MRGKARRASFSQGMLKVKQSFQTCSQRPAKRAALVSFGNRRLEKPKVDCEAREACGAA